MADRKRAGAFACVMGLFSALALMSGGCGGGDKLSEGSASSRSLNGTWLRSALTFEGRSITCPTGGVNQLGSLTSELTVNGILLDVCVAGETITFNSNGTYSAVYPAPRFINLTTESGTFTTGNGTITLKRLVSGYDANGDGIIGAGETKTLIPVTNANALPANPQQRLVFTYSLRQSVLNLTPVQQSVTDSSGTPVVNSDGTVNITVAEAENEYARQ